MQPIEKYLGSVCQIITDKPGTGFLVAPGIVLTCSHVLPPSSKDDNPDKPYSKVVERARALFPGIKEAIELNPDEKQGGFFISRPYNYDPEKTENPKIFSYEHLDFTLVALKELPDQTRIPRPVFRLTEAIPQEQQSTHLIHYPVFEPGNPSHVHVGEQEHPLIRIMNIYDHFQVHFKGDSLGGSSGGPLINEKGELLAFHQGECACKKVACLCPPPKHQDCKVAVRTDAVARFICGIENIDIRLKDLEIEHLRDELKIKYKNQNEITIFRPSKSDGEWKLKLPNKNIFCRLAIITGVEQKEKSQAIQDGVMEAVEDDRIPTYEKIQFGHKESIDLKTLFEHESLIREKKRKVLILGSAGIGKSTLCQHIAYQWAEGDLWPQYKALFWISLRNLNHVFYPSREKPYTIEDVLEKECGCHTTLLKNEKFLDSCLLVLDGYDELQLEKDDQHLQHIFEDFKKRFPHILVTSRPQPVEFDEVSKLEILGFDKNSIPQYIDHFYEEYSKKTGTMSSEEKNFTAEQFKDQLKIQPQMFSLAHIPINLSLLCTLFIDDKELFHSEQPVTMTSIYKRMTDWLFIWYMRRSGAPESKVRSIADNPRCHETVDNLTKALAAIAWTAMERNRLYLPKNIIQSELRKNGIDPLNIVDLGLLRIDHTIGHFIHLSFQEYFAALYLANLYISDKREDAKTLIAKNKFISRFSLVFSMTAGDLSSRDETEPLTAYFDDMLSKPYDLAKTYEIILLARCFEECKNPSSIRQYENFMKIVRQETHNLIHLKTRSVEVFFAIIKKLIQDKEVVNIITGIIKDERLPNISTPVSSQYEKIWSILLESVKKGIILQDEIILELIKNFRYNNSMPSGEGMLVELIREGQSVPEKGVQQLIEIIEDCDQKPMVIRTAYVRSLAYNALDLIKKNGQHVPKTMDKIKPRGGFLYIKGKTYLDKVNNPKAWGLLPWLLPSEKGSTSKEYLLKLITLAENPKKESHKEVYITSELNEVQVQNYDLSDESIILPIIKAYCYTNRPVFIDDGKLCTIDRQGRKQETTIGKETSDKISEELQKNDIDPINWRL